MPNLASVRSQLKEWLAAQIRIDEFDADPPRRLQTRLDNRPVPANTCISYPVSNLDFAETGFESITGTATFSYSIVYRFAQELTLETLPISDLESVAQYLRARSILSLAGCGAIRRVAPLESEYPIQISRDGTDQDDWLVYVHLSLRASFALTEFGISPDYGVPTDDTDVALNSIGLKTYRANLGLTPSTLDSDILLTLED